jgi:hypothetical protein
LEKIHAVYSLVLRQLFCPILSMQSCCRSDFFLSCLWIFWLALFSSELFKLKGLLLITKLCRLDFFQLLLCNLEGGKLLRFIFHQVSSLTLFLQFKQAQLFLLCKVRVSHLKLRGRHSKLLQLLQRTICINDLWFCFSLGWR